MAITPTFAWTIAALQGFTVELFGKPENGKPVKTHRVKVGEQGFTRADALKLDKLRPYGWRAF